jgi:hypothetical protein
VFWTACQNPRTFPEDSFRALESADRMDIVTSTKQVRSIVQPWRIRNTARLLQLYTKGWERPFTGTPLPELVVNFFKGQDRLGSFGIGDDFITMGEDHLWCQPLLSKDRDKLLEWLAVKERRSPAI